MKTISAGKKCVNASKMGLCWGSPAERGAIILAMLRSKLPYGASLHVRGSMVCSYIIGWI